MRMSAIKVPFPMPACLGQPERHRQMKESVERGFPRLAKVPVANKTISLIGYGPSLKDTWTDIKRPMMTMSGSHDFLVERGVIPEFHCDMDPRKHKVRMLTPHPQVHYLMASVCHPLIWEKLQGFKVALWHAVSGDLTVNWIKMNDPDALLVSGGSCIGLVAIHLAGCLGFNHFELHGYDGSYRGAERHAGPDQGHPQGRIDTKIWGHWYPTSKIMENANVELQNLLNWFPVFVVFHGEGRNQKFAELTELPNVALHGTPKAEMVRTGKVIYTNKEEFEKLIAV